MPERRQATVSISKLTRCSTADGEDVQPPARHGDHRGEGHELPPGRGSSPPKHRPCEAAMQQGGPGWPTSISRRGEAASREKPVKARPALPGVRGVGVPHGQRGGAQGDPCPPMLTRASGPPPSAAVDQHPGFGAGVADKPALVPAQQHRVVPAGGGVGQVDVAAFAAADGVLPIQHGETGCRRPRPTA